METIKLIDGHFTPEEAKEVLLNIIAKKINFHNLKNLSSQVRYNRPDTDSEVRIRELEEARAQVLALVQEAKAERGELVVEATIYLTIKDSEQSSSLCSAVESY